MTQRFHHFSRKLLAFLVVLLAVSLSVAQTYDSQRWVDPDGKPLPFQTGEEVEKFLRTAEVISIENIPTGITHPRKVLLEKEGIRMHAIFRDVHEARRVATLSDGSTKFDFRDDAIFESAAYELGKLLGLDTVPPAVERRIRGKKGTLQAWIEKAMTERGMRSDNIQPPSKGTYDGWRWIMQWQMIHIFDNLIYNEDRSQDNVLIDPNWRLWMIDHTRAFRRWKALIYPEKILYCERSLWEKLQTLDEAVVKERLKDFLSPREINGLLERRRLLVEHVQNLIDEHGEGGVLYTMR